MRSTEFSALLQFFIIDVYKKKAGQAPFALARLCLSNANGVNLFIQGLRRFNRAGKVSFFRRARNGNQPIRSADACFISPPVASGKIPVVEHAYLFTLTKQFLQIIIVSHITMSKRTVSYTHLAYQRVRRVRPFSALPLHGRVHRCRLSSGSVPPHSHRHPVFLCRKQ